MNEIEQLFYDAYVKYNGCEGEEDSYIKPHFAVGIYLVDFKLSDNIVVEIDGHEFHKTKEQREKDYVRERYLQKHGLVVVRFTGTEVYVNANKCVEELYEIENFTNSNSIEHFVSGRDSAYRNVLKYINSQFTENFL